MKRSLIIALATAGIGFAGHASAAEMDMAKVTCKDLAGMPTPRAIGVGLWMSGYVNGKAGKTMLDSDTMAANAKKVVDYCADNPDATLMSAIDAAGKS